MPDRDPTRPVNTPPGRRGHAALDEVVAVIRPDRFDAQRVNVLRPDTCGLAAGHWAWGMS
jgi:hypothetical protein